MKKNNLECPSCNSTTVDTIGAITPAIYFSGQRLTSPIPGGSLHRCRFCHLYFRYPRLSKDELDDLYLNTHVGNWQGSQSSRTDWQIAEKWIHRYSEGTRLLDIGCYDGGFLRLMDEKFECYGIEINSEAANHARAKNIEIIGDDFDDIEKISFEFDVVVAMDVFEHVENPANLLKSMARIVRSGGLLIVSTGNTESWSWRMMGSHYWYCTVPEHISFINLKWCRHVAAAENLKIVGSEFYAHCENMTILQRMVELSKNLAYYFFPGIVSWLRIKGFGGVDAITHKTIANTPPMWFSATDHIFIVFQKH